MACAPRKDETRHCCGEKSIRKRYPERASFQLFGRMAHICDEDQNTRDEKTIRNATVPPVCVDVPGNIAYPSSRLPERPPRTSTRSQRGRPSPAGDPRAAICTTVESWKWNVRHCARWRCVVSGWKVGAALGSHRKCVPWFQLRLAAHASPSGHVAVIAKCWRSRKATVPKEVLCGARSHRGGCPPHDFRAYVDVPVFGARCVTQVQCGWRWNVVDGSVNCPSTDSICTHTRPSPC